LAEKTSFAHSHTAFVLGLYDTGLGAIRSLGRLGVPVIGLDSDRRMPGFKSKFCAAKLCPDPVHKPHDLVRFLFDEGRRLEEPGILFPGSDDFVLFLSRYREDLAAHFRFALPPADVVEAILNKRRQYELAERLDTPYPRTFYPETREDVQRLKGELEYPVFIKPYYGHLWRGRFGGPHRGFKARTPQELIDRFEETVPTGLQVMVQSIIVGPNSNHFKVNVYMDRTGKPLAVFTLRKIRQYPTEFGAGTTVESLRYPELIDLGLKFFQGIGYHGIGSIEFKKDERDGKLYMIELNPRLWQQNIQATVCGINFPLVQYLDLTDHAPPPQTEFEERVRWWDAQADFLSFWWYFQRGELSPWAWLRSLVGISSFATFAWDDLGPFLRAYDYGVKFLRIPVYLSRHGR
jgi:predicted ATP-grasp superfamily ATP-dependent carboligase